MQIAAVILGLTVLGGVLLAGLRFSGIPRPPTWLALGHGVLAVAGLGTLIYAAMSGGIPVLAKTALAGFILAALGGLGLFLGFHLRQRALPIPIIIVHGLIAITSYVLLLISLKDLPVE